uniref:Methyltransf_11 domain-containing protein n=1 Tax=Ganoderma boninense TaxID=34458 RepID=A0A5K1JW77_9APHY|nr:Methyltransf_11 domain-containing protein [Ganoderma boninense]
MYSHLTTRISSVLVSHFLLDLQDAFQRTIHGLATDDPSGLSQGIGSSVDFANALGSVGATIDPAADQALEEEDHVDGQVPAEDILPNENESEPGEHSRAGPDSDEFEIMEVPRRLVPVPM